MSMAKTSIRHEIVGYIADIDHTGYLKIVSALGRYSVSQNRICNAPGGHRCLVRVDDEVGFLLNHQDRITEVRFLHRPDAKLAQEETSVVETIHDDLIFGKRIEPDCHCPILIGLHNQLPRSAWSSNTTSGFTTTKPWQQTFESTGIRTKTEK
jgi:hypothetical protein